MSNPPRSHPLLSRAAAAALALTLGALAAGPASAQFASAQFASAQTAVVETLTVAKDKSVAFRLAYPVGEIVVAQPDIVQLVATTDQSFYIRGKTMGLTNLLIFD